MKKNMLMALVLVIAGATQFHASFAGDANNDYGWYLAASNNPDWVHVANTFTPGNLSPADSTVYEAQPTDAFLNAVGRANRYKGATPSGLTALMQAAAEGNIDMINKLLALGADKDIETPQADTNDHNGLPFKKGWTALDFAIQKGNDAVINALGGIPDYDGGRLLHYAVVKGDIAKVNAALDKYPDAQAINDSNVIALAVAKGDLDLVKLLKDRDATLSPEAQKMIDAAEAAQKAKEDAALAEAAAAEVAAQTPAVVDEVIAVAEVAPETPAATGQVATDVVPAVAAEQVAVEEQAPAQQAPVAEAPVVAQQQEQAVKKAAPKQRAVPKKQAAPQQQQPQATPKKRAVSKKK